MKELIGKPIAEKIEKWCIDEVKKIKEEKNMVPSLRVLQYGDDAASKRYVSRIEKNCENIGIKFEYKIFNDDEQAFIDCLNDANTNPEITSIMVQQPLPPSLKYTIETINSDKDIEGITSSSLGKLFAGFKSLVPCTAQAVIEIIDYYNIDVEGKEVVVIGRSNIVGKPVSILLQKKNATVTMCHSRTKDLEGHLKRADIVVAATGKAGLINGNMLSKDTVVIDVGTNFVDGKLVGDVDYESAKELASQITPVPGGVGAVTNKLLMRNIVESFKNIYS
jgi:methylenetetrahydrofolate dehydrogenase (NADP+) / methenyltetrahydrofolate cyclohydrolase